MLKVYFCAGLRIGEKKITAIRSVLINSCKTGTREKESGGRDAGRPNPVLFYALPHKPCSFRTIHTFPVSSREKR
jgi:hypothetical protein